MAREVLNDTQWNEVLEVMKSKGCYNTKNTRKVMEAIIWKLRTGAPWRDIPQELCSWKTAFNRFNRWAAKGLWEDFFLNYEAKLTKNGYTSMEVMYARINMQAELGLVKNEQLAELVEGLPQKSICPPTRMETRFILKSLGVRSMT